MTDARLDVRKTVTVVVCDLVGSTPLAERLDPETFAGIVASFHDLVQTVLQRHGGAVQQYPGDAVLAAFGIPALHEDDALRAVTSAVELRSELARLNEELDRAWGERLETRIGVNTGEAALDQRAIVLGDTANVAARLQQVAGAGEILIGQRTRDLVRRSATLEQVPGLLLKGKRLPVAAWRVLGVDPGSRDRGRRLDTPMIGRELELDTLHLAYRRSVAERRCHLVTVLGEAGVGKTRLVNELESRIGAEATILRGRCPYYGENVDYWPFLEVVRQAAGIRPDDSADTAMERLSSLTVGERMVTTRLAQMLGLRKGTGTPETASWALGHLIQLLAASQPVVLVIDDLHWATPTLLDLIEQVADRAREAPLLLVCMARPEFHHDRQDWRLARPNVTSFTLSPLEGDRIGELITHLLEGGALDAALRRRLADAAPGYPLGYPLFAEELVAMLVDQGALRLRDGRWTLTEELDELPTPANIEALLAARLERLSAEERAVIGPAAVIGARFLASEVAALASPSQSDGGAMISSALHALVRKELLLPDSTAATEGGDPYRFRHALIHDAAYRAVSKKSRAELHERYADWLERVAGADAAKVDEQLAHHLKKAYDLRVELGQAHEAMASLRRRAGERLAAAGASAALRGDAPNTAARLLADAVELLPAAHPMRLQAQLQLADSLREAWLTESPSEEGRNQVVDAYDTTIEAARALGDRRVELWAELGRLELVWFKDLKTLLDAEPLVEEATQEFEWLQDDLGLARVWHVQAYIRAAVGRSSAARRAAEQAMRLAQRAGEVRLEGRSRHLLCFVLDWGPTPVDEVARYVDETLEWAERQGLQGLAIDAHNVLARAEAMRGDFAAARARIRAIKAIVRSSSQPLLSVTDEVTEAQVDLLMDDPAAAEQILRGAYAELTRMGGQGAGATVATLLARALLAQDRDEEAERLAWECQKMAPESQLEAQIRWREIQAVVQSRRGEADSARQLAREAVDLAQRSEQLDSRALATYNLAEVLGRAGQRDQAVEAARTAVELWREKGNLVSARKAQRLLDDLGARPG